MSAGRIARARLIRAWKKWGTGVSLKVFARLTAAGKGDTKHTKRVGAANLWLANKGVR